MLTYGLPRAQRGVLDLSDDASSFPRLGNHRRPQAPVASVLVFVFSPELATAARMGRSYAFGLAIIAVLIASSWSAGGNDLDAGWALPTPGNSIHLRLIPQPGSRVMGALRPTRPSRILGHPWAGVGALLTRERARQWGRRLGAGPVRMLRLHHTPIGR
jgi:hypothetical protein